MTDVVLSLCVLPQTASDTCCPPSHLQEAFLGWKPSLLRKPAHWPGPGICTHTHTHTNSLLINFINISTQVWEYEDSAQLCSSTYAFMLYAKVPTRSVCPWPPTQTSSGGCKKITEMSETRKSSYQDRRSTHTNLQPKHNKEDMCLRFTAL